MIAVLYVFAIAVYCVVFGIAIGVHVERRRRKVKEIEMLLTAARDEVRTGHAQGALVQAVEAIEGRER